MFAFTALAAFAAAALPQALAHGGVLSYKIGGQIFQGWAVRAAPHSSLLHPSTPVYLSLADAPPARSFWPTLDILYLE